MQKESDYYERRSVTPSPNWLRPAIFAQVTLGAVLVLTGIGHIVSKGYLANIGTGIYAGITEIVCAFIQLRALKPLNGMSNLNACKFAICIALILCAVNVPLVSILSMVMGDANGYPHKSCRYIGQIADSACIVVIDAPNVGALLCDAVLLVAGLVSGILLAKSGTYFLPMNYDQDFMHNSDI